MDKEPLFILAGNGPYENRGCEAIVRGTVQILRDSFKNPRFICLSYFQSEQQYQNQCKRETDDAIIHLAHRNPHKITIQNFYKPNTWTSLFHHFLNTNIPDSSQYHDLLPYLGNASAVLSIGGDNYSLDYGVPTRFTELDDIVYERGKPMILWGASVGPFSTMPKYERYMHNHLNKITGIFAREPITIDYLHSMGVTRNVHPVSDPAFIMDPVEPKGIDNIMPIEEGAIGINLSPLLAKYVTRGNLEQWIKISANVIETIAIKTEKPIFLIPHVTINGSDDYLFMQKALSLIHKKKENIILVPPVYDAAETKWIISRMAFFAGARTHSTIAALSSCVPTLSFVYSIKAQGINKDIFHHTKYCLDATEINSNLISDKIISMMDRDALIREELGELIPNIKQSARNAGNILKRITEEDSNA